jgi:uncharacterized protein (TIGR03437 family)
MRPDRVTVVWSIRETDIGQVQYSTDPTFPASSTNTVTATFVRFIPESATQTVPGGFNQFNAVLTGLTAPTVYYYRVLYGTQNLTNDGTHAYQQFRTPVPTGHFRFLVFGDSGLNSPAQQSVLNQMLTETPDLVLHVGDIAYDSGTYDEFGANYFDYYFSMMWHVPFFPVPGNHEYYTDAGAPYFSLHFPPTNTVPPIDAGHYYSFDWGDAHFVSLDANLLDVSFNSSSQLAWLDQDLSATNAKWRIAYWHQVPYAIAHHIDDPIDIAARQLFNPILERHGVQLVIGGHEHIYARTKILHGDAPVTNGPGTLYLTTGGGGGPLHELAVQPWLDSCPALSQGRCMLAAYHYLAIDVDSGSIKVHAIGTDGKELDTATLTLPAFDPSAVVNAASFTTALAPGGLVTIFGSGLSNSTSSAPGFPLPTSMGGTTVTVNGTSLPLIYVSPGQINAQLPMDVRGTATLAVASSAGAAQAPINIADAAPAVFTGGVQHANGTLVSASAPAVPGETLVIYATGLGPVNGPLTSGQAAPQSPLYSAVNPVVVNFGSESATPSYAGLTPGYAGVYQVNVAVPGDLATNVYPLTVVAKGNASNVNNVQVKGH